MSSITEGAVKQYATSEKLAARARLHQAYTHDDNPWFPWVATNMELAPGQSVLDLGCGPGWFWVGAGDAVPAGIRLTLADLSAHMVEEATSRCRGLGFASVEGVVADAVSLPFPDASFDRVIAMHMLYHVRDQQAALAEMHRVLKPGGLLGATTNDRDNLAALNALTTVFGTDGTEPAGAAFGFARASELLSTQFGNVDQRVNPGRLRITEPEDVFMALTSYPPGDGAPDDQIAAFRARIAEAFARGQGVLEAEKRMGLFVSRRG
jgi:SAM-dependent methyltransferase